MTYKAEKCYSVTGQRKGVPARPDDPASMNNAHDIHSSFPKESAPAAQQLGRFLISYKMVPPSYV